MGSLPSKQPVFEEQWLVDACSSEIRAHRLIFLLVLSPLLGLWLPYIMFYLGLSVLIQVQANIVGKEVSDGSAWLNIAMVVSSATPLAVIFFGLLREKRRLSTKDKGAIASGMKLPKKQGALLAAQLKLIWDGLKGEDAVPPRLVCQPNFGVLAHAYDGQDGQTIEVSAGLASRVVRGDSLAISILRHEVAHLVHGDLPAIRSQSMVAGAAIFSADVALALCVLAAGAVITVTDLGKFPLPTTAANIISLHLAVLLAAFIVTIPLLLGRFIVKRYAGFIVALIEMRADVSAGIWGEGLAAFSSRLEKDPSVRATTIRDVGLAYISSSLSHLPAQERAFLLSNPGRLATPKLNYFAVAMVVIWLLAFHQGSEVWDFLLLSAIVALLQALTVQMVISVRGRVRLTPTRAATLAIGLLASQALPLISIEGLAYLAEHLTAAIVHPGGFGSGDGADYLKDVVETFEEFGRFVAQATGGLGFGISTLLTASSLWLMSRLTPSPRAQSTRIGTATVMATVAVVSVAVSYKFFQEALYWPVRLAAFASSDSESGSPAGFWALLPADFRHLLSKALWDFSEFLHGPPALASYPWLRLALPNLFALLVALLAFGMPHLRRKFSPHRTWR